MPVSLVHQSVQNLRYALIEGEVDLSPFGVKDSHTFTWEEWTVILHTLSASHAIVFAKRGEGQEAQVTELLACTALDEITLAFTRLELDDLTEMNAKRIESEGLQLDVKTSSLSFALSGKANLQFTTDALSTEYPEENRTTSITKIGYRASGKRLLIETLHTYPAETRIVRTLTRVSLVPTEKETVYE